MPNCEWTVILPTWEETGFDRDGYERLRAREASPLIGMLAGDFAHVMLSSFVRLPPEHRQGADDQRHQARGALRRVAAGLRPVAGDPRTRLGTKACRVTGIRDDFAPPARLRNPHVQSIYPSLPFRRPVVERRSRRLIEASEDLVLDCGEGVRLLAHHATQQRTGRPAASRLAVLLHGWEGSANSLYLLSLGQRLIQLVADNLQVGELHIVPAEFLDQLLEQCWLE